MTRFMQSKAHKYVGDLLGRAVLGTCHCRSRSAGCYVIAPSTGRSETSLAGGAGPSGSYPSRVGLLQFVIRGVEQFRNDEFRY